MASSSDSDSSIVSKPPHAYMKNPDAPVADTAMYLHEAFGDSAPFVYQYNQNARVAAEKISDYVCISGISYEEGGISKLRRSVILRLPLMQWVQKTTSGLVSLRMKVLLERLEHHCSLNNSVLLIVDPNGMVDKVWEHVYPKHVMGFVILSPAQVVVSIPDIDVEKSTLDGKRRLKRDAHVVTFKAKDHAVKISIGVTGTFELQTMCYKGNEWEIPTPGSGCYSMSGRLSPFNAVSSVNGHTLAYGVRDLLKMFIDLSRGVSDDTNKLQLTPVVQQQQQQQQNIPSADNSKKRKREDSEARLCIVCFENEINTIFMPCMHSACCNVCAAKIMASTNVNCPYDNMHANAYMTYINVSGSLETTHATDKKQ